MIDETQLTALLHELRALAAQAQKRGEKARADDLPQLYYYGVKFGLETAVERLDALLHADSD